MIRLSHISKSFPAAAGSALVLDDVSLTIESGEIFGIIGESGAGKSTLVRCINLLERPDSGVVEIDGVDVTAADERNLRLIRRGVGMIFQQLSLFQQRTVLDNVRFPATLSADRTPVAEQRARALKLLDLVGLSEKADAYPSKLSGGQQQRVAIARALMTGPSILLCDEATSALDTLTTQTVLELLARINKELGVTIVLITHSLAVARKICDRIAVLDRGVLVEQGPVAQVFAAPQAQTTRDLLNTELCGEVA